MKAFNLRYMVRKFTIKKKMAKKTGKGKEISKEN